MKMPTIIDNIMFAPCGINCMVCYKHCNSKKPCIGCLAGDLGKTEHCRKCKIKDCVNKKELTYCFECVDFPCMLIKNLEKSYNKRYQASLIKNGLSVKEFGLVAFLTSDREEWTCSSCGGIISLHESRCSECKQQKATKNMK